MKIRKILFVFLVLVVTMTTCEKDHYDVTNIQGINAEGEVLLPIASASYTMQDLMTRFELDDLINFTDDGNMSYGFSYEHPGAVSGSHLLYFKDWSYEEHFHVENPIHGPLIEPIDTIVNMSQLVTFETDHIRVLSALMKSGRFEFNLESNIANLGEVVVSTSDIQDANGRDLRFVYRPESGQTGFDLAGLHYQTSEANTLTLNYRFHVHIVGFDESEIKIDAYIHATDLAIEEMSGYVESYESRNRIDTTFSLFPSNFSGTLGISAAKVRVSERNTFDLAARLVVDTAMVFGEGITPYAIFDPMPVTVELPSQTAFSEVFSHNLHGALNAVGGHAVASSLFVVNTSGSEEIVTVYDTCNIDVNVDVDIPFAFSIDQVCYVDTVDVQLSQIEMPEMLEQLTLELTFNSTLPLNLYGQFYMYDSMNECVIDSLLSDERLIGASFDGRPTTTTLSLEITEDRIENLLRSDHIIMQYVLDTKAQDVTFNASQKLEMFVKARAKYKGTVDFQTF